ncbi:hypothetical protein BCR44DRAFT_42306, partial [Catenaria anguillulae PL171]
MKFPIPRNLRARLITARAVLLYLLFWVGMVLASFFIHQADQERDKERAAAIDSSFISANTTSSTQLLVFLLIKTIDPISASAKVGMTLFPSEDLVRRFEAGGRIVGSTGAVGEGVKQVVIDNPDELALMAILNRPVMARGMAVMARGFRKNFPAGSRLPNEDTFTVPFTKSSVRGYPYDSHSGNLDVSAFLFPDPATNSTSTPLQIQVVIENGARGFKFAPGSPSTPPGKARGPFFVEATFRLQRSLITIGFSIFIIGMLWILSIVIGFLALQVTTKERPAVAAMLGPPISLLFALPSLRNVQPQAPPVGSTSDVLGFFWNMVIVALSAVAIIYAFIDGWTPPPPPTKEAEPLIKAS